MKKLLTVAIIFAIMLAMICSLGACAKTTLSVSDNDTVASSSETSEKNPLAQWTPTPGEPPDSSDYFAVEAATRNDPIIDEVLAALAADQRSDLSAKIIPFSASPARNNLDATQQAMYDKMLNKIKAVEPVQFLLSEWGSLDLNYAYAVYSALIEDYPELKSYSYADTIQKTTGQITGVEILYLEPSTLWKNENPDPQRIRDDMALFDAVVDRIIQRIPANASAYDKYRYLAYVQSLIESYDYDLERDRSDPWSGIMAGQSVCEGYAWTFYYLCKEAGLWCSVIEGTVIAADDNDHHVWNLVQLDTGTYFIDVTWSDAGDPSLGSDEWMRYFMMDQATASIDHDPDDGTVAAGSNL
ncbi:MAG: hypothetical protein LBB42_02760 [Coriobacteriales bacterium]|jgi:transglutaminase/protease-like cytokinesis protein 3|nr:hypothetical protein [Coriobacteriales bacterium]